MKYYCIIQTEEQLTEQWQDENMPGRSFQFDQSLLSECQQVEGGYKATFNAVHILQLTSYVGYFPEGRKEVKLIPGIYGLNPNYECIKA